MNPTQELYESLKKDQVNENQNLGVPSVETKPTPELSAPSYLNALAHSPADEPIDPTEHNAMVETIEGLEKERDQLLQLCRMSLQQLDFLAGKRMRGWDLSYLRECLQAAISESEGDGPDYHSILSKAMEWLAAFPHQGTASEFDTNTAQELYEELRRALVLPVQQDSAEEKEDSR
jgi:hypothetical protein